MKKRGERKKIYILHFNENFEQNVNHPKRGVLIHKQKVEGGGKKRKRELALMEFLMRWIFGLMHI